GNVQFIKNTESLTGLLFITEQRYSGQRQNVIGEYYIGTPKPVEGVVDYCEMWDASGNEISWWREFVNSGRVSRKVEQIRRDEFKPAGAIVVRKKLTPYEKKEVYFVVCWFMPNCVTQYVKKTPQNVIKENDADTTKALDENLNTYWSTKRRMLAGDVFMVDLGAIKTISGITLNSHGAPNEYPRGCELLGSVDSEHWFFIKKVSAKEVRKIQQDGIVNIDFSPVATRYLKINQLSTLPDYAWRISELRVFNKKKRKIEEIKPVSATAYLVQESEEVITEDVSHYYTNYFESAVDVAEYAFQNKEELLLKTEEWQSLIWKSNLPFWLKLKLINTAFVMFSNTIFTRDGRFSVLESPVSMAGALGTSDQRMSAHAFCSMFFPELDQRELELFAKCQSLVEPVADGRIPHFTGNINEIVGNPNVRGGVRDWPDLSCSWVMQVLKFYRWTGDMEFLQRQWNHIQRAMNWLENADDDGDGIPEGGSTFDYEHPKRGAFCYTASCYLGALNSARAIATALGEQKQATKYQQRFNLVQKNMIKSLWNGKYFIKWYNPLTGEKNSNCFVAQLAGDWLSQLSGVGEILPREKSKSAIKEIVERNVKPFYPIPPMEVTPEGKSAVSACYIIQQETYLGMEAIYAGYADEGLEVIKRVYDTVWLKNYDPWSQALWYNVETGGLQGLVYYMTSPATWHVLNALTGVTIDLSAEILYINPQLPTDIHEWHLPLFFPRFWLWLDYIPREKKLQIQVLKTYSNKELFISKIISGKDKLPIKLPEKFKIKEKAVLDLSPYFDKFLELRAK
ncbi:MAG: GH116 family glycosyl hydrolase, partial [Candidatus Sumerlaeia bacterium]|nr:GH116 family glycosyl hydrolase [Candidatus Sumerlaeia bacterium]